jgi:glycyl-tRNA synthetase beta chain
MPDLLLEIGTEELPPFDIAPALAQLAERVRTALTDLRLDGGEVRTIGTPRRLVCLCWGVPLRQRPAVREVRGPAAQVAFDAAGRPTPAAVGFARSHGIPVERLRVQEVAGKRYALAVVEEKGHPASQVLPAALAAAVLGVSFTKTMRWSDRDIRFARPIRWVVALLDKVVLPLELAGCRATRVTHGHRMLHPGPHSVSHPRRYEGVLKAAGVIADPADRRQIIVRQATDLARRAQGAPLLDPRLLDEIVMSTEHPQALRGAFEAQFLTLPRPVLVTVMQHHQKYFAVEEGRSTLRPFFIAVRDGNTKHLATVQQGHEWVLQARLTDARFFFQEDRKHRLADVLPRLEGVTFLAQLGTMAEKTRRLVNLARQVSTMLLLDGHTSEALVRAATLCKADLVTHMVGEFPELQGTMGQIYAELDGEPTEVARAIGEHHRPTGGDDSPPKTEVGALLGLVDKLDTLVGALGAGLVPSGSQDPYGLRRAGQGIVEIVQMLRLHLPLQAPASAARAGYGNLPRSGVVEEVVDFLRQRLRTVLTERGRRYDLVDAALAVSGDDLLAAADRAGALQAYATRPEFSRLWVAYDRASRILTAPSGEKVDSQKFESPTEHRLYEAITATTPKVSLSVAAGDMVKAMEHLVVLAEPVDRLFDDVLIMAPDPAVRANRLALLRSVTEVFRLIADFSKVVMADAQAPAAVRQRGTEQAKTKKPSTSR